MMSTSSRSAQSFFVTSSKTYFKIVFPTRSGCTAHITKAFTRSKYQHAAHSVHFSALEATEELKPSLSYLDCCGGTGECDQSTCSLILHCRTRGLQQVVDAANEPSSLWWICVTDLDKRMIHSWHIKKRAILQLTCSTVLQREEN